MVEATTELFAEINAAHVFREGNGRTQRAFLSQAAARAGLQLDWAQVDGYTNAQVSRAARGGDWAPLEAVLDRITGPAAAAPAGQSPAADRAELLRALEKSKQFLGAARGPAQKGRLGSRARAVAYRRRAEQGAAGVPPTVGSRPAPPAPDPQHGPSPYL